MSNCLECNQSLTRGVIDFSLNSYGIPLCMDHQSWVQQMQSQTTEETLRLYFALKERGVPAEIEKFDGFKHIDIAIPDAKVNIEVDGRHHHYDARQALADLKRTYHSFAKGYLTFRIPNSLVYNENVLNETADYLVGILNENLKNNNSYRRKY
jgi:very-short-patch-repair endonuclease